MCSIEGWCCCLFSSSPQPLERSESTLLYYDIRPEQVPIIYSSKYNIRFLGIEKLHPFDSTKWGKIFNFLTEAGIVSPETVVEPREATEEDLLVVHTPEYLKKLSWSAYVATVTEIPCVACLPNRIVQNQVLKPFRYHTGGSILAGKLALERGWAINLGGGFHHCSKDTGGGFCAYADITLCLTFLFNNFPSVTKAMIIDLDAHQGNGHERDFLNDKRVYILDMYNKYIYPHDEPAKLAIDRNVPLKSRVGDQEYIDNVNFHVPEALAIFNPDFVVYNAGTDILERDPLGNLSITAEGIIKRDQHVFKAVRDKHVPIVMFTSGGYLKHTARIVADSIINLRNEGLI